MTAAAPPNSAEVATAAPHLLDTAVLGEHLDRLYRAALALCGSRPDAEDLVQETCVRVLSKPRLLRGRDLAYLFAVLRNTFFTQQQTHARRRTTPVDPSTLGDMCTDLRFDPETGFLAGEVHRAISGLPDNYRTAVVAVDVLGLSYADAARTLGVPEGTIMSRLYRGRARVAACVGGPVTAA